MRLSRIILACLLLSSLGQADSPAEIKVRVQGQVVSPGIVSIKEDDPWPLLRALGKAGGPTECAAKDRIHIRRGGQMLTVDRFDEIRLQDGDVISLENVRCTMVDSVEGPRSIELTHRSLGGLFGSKYAACQGMVVHRMPDRQRYDWAGARCFDGHSDSRMVLQEDDLIVVSFQNEPRSVTARVVGEVQNPGSFRFKSDSTALDLLAVSGGLAPNADIAKVSLVHGGKEQPVQDLMQLSTIRLLPLDTLRVDTLDQIKVRVDGAVQTPGVYSVSPKCSDPLGEIIQSAGGVKKTAAIHRVLLHSWKGPIPVDLDRAHPPLQHRDYLFIDSQHCFVYGAVEKQGQVSLTGGETLSSVLHSCGVNRAQLGKVELFRASDSSKDNSRCETYDLSKPELAPVVSVGDGDVIRVPLPNESERIPYFDGPNFQYYRWESLPRR